MKSKIIFLLTILIPIVSFSQEQKGIIGTENWLENWTNFKPNDRNYPAPDEILNGQINKNKTLTKKNTYLLTGNVYVTNNAILTIEPGTIIKGDFESCGTLIVTKGSKIIANGLATDPIIFTSDKEIQNRKSGDWGGLIILGDAPINKFGGKSKINTNVDNKYSEYGGENESSDSGIIKYVRIEYAGKKLNKESQYNGLTLAGIGNKTILEYIQVSYSNDDSFECRGGTFNLKNLVSYKATDDDFDYTQGTQCVVNNSLAIRYPYFSDIGKSRCFEIDSYDKIENMDFTKKMTNVTAINFTAVNNEENNENLVREAIFIRDNSIFKLEKSVVCGFKSVVLVGENKLKTKSNLENLILDNNLFSDCKKFIINENDEITINDNEEVKEEVSILVSKNKFDTAKCDALFFENNTKKNADFRIKNNSTFAFSK